MARFDRVKKVDAQDVIITITDFSSDFPKQRKETLTLIGNPSERNYMLKKALDALTTKDVIAHLSSYATDVYPFTIRYNLLTIFPLETLYSGTVEDTFDK